MQQIQQKMKLKVPSLTSSISQSVLSLTALLSGAVVAPFALGWTQATGSSPMPQWPILLNVALCFLVIPAIMYCILTRQLAYAFPAQTVGDLTKGIVEEYRERIGLNGDPWSPATVWKHYQHIISSVTTIDPKEITPDMNFFDDLGCG
jgi:hypothetical protein